MIINIDKFEFFAQLQGVQMSFLCYKVVFLGIDMLNAALFDKNLQSKSR